MSGRVHRLLARARTFAWPLAARGALAAAPGAARRHPLLLSSTLALLTWDRLVAPPAAFYPSAQAVYYMTATLGAAWICGSMMAAGIGVVADGRGVGVRRMAWWMCERVVLFALLLTAERHFAPEISGAIAATRAYPDQALQAGAAVALLALTFRMTPAARVVAGRGDYIAAPGDAALARGPRKPRPPQDIRRTAVHEAGHLIAFAALGALPPDLKVEVKRDAGRGDSYAGQVSHTGRLVNVPTESVLRWTMLMTLAGTEAESLVLGERGDGAWEDNERWVSAATDFLAQGFGEVFYGATAGESQRDHNRAVLNDLRAACRRDLAEFLLANRVLLDDLADALCSGDGTMSRSALAPMLANVVMTGLPMPRDAAWEPA